MQRSRDAIKDTLFDFLRRSKCCNCGEVEEKNNMGVTKLCRCFAYMKSAEDLLKRILCLDIIICGEHVEKRGLSPAPRTEEHILEGCLFQKRDEVGFINNNCAGLVEEVGKLCVRWEKKMTAVLEQH